jgi:hypothetical protein
MYGVGLLTMNLINVTLILVLEIIPKRTSSSPYAILWYVHTSYGCITGGRCHSNGKGKFCMVVAGDPSKFRMADPWKLSKRTLLRWPKVLGSPWSRLKEGADSLDQFSTMTPKAWSGSTQSLSAPSFNLLQGLPNTLGHLNRGLKHLF